MIEVGTVLRHETGNEYTVMYMGDTHGVAKLTKQTVNSLKPTGSEMGFHKNITESTLWTIVQPMPEVRERYYLIANDGINGEGFLEHVPKGAIAAWRFVRKYPETYVGVVRVNPDHTWDYVNENGDVQS